MAAGDAPATGFAGARSALRARVARVWSSLTAGMTPAIALVLGVAAVIAAVPEFRSYGSDLDSGWAIGVTLAYEQ